MHKYIARLIVGGGLSLGLQAHALEPCDPAAYFTNVGRTIDVAVNGQPRFAVTTFPSFEAEHGVRIVGSIVYSVRLSASFWDSSVVNDTARRYHHDFSKPRVKTSVEMATLTPELANRIIRVYANAMTRTGASDRQGLDGTTYYFEMPRIGCRKTWSPTPDSPNGQLVELAELLAAHAESRRSFISGRSEQKIVQKLIEIEHLGLETLAPAGSHPGLSGRR